MHGRELPPEPSFMSKARLQAPRGTRDFYPEDVRRRDWLFAHFRAVSRAFAFEEIDAPLVEHAELFIRKAGEEIVDQLYHFTLHERHLALRPELTPSLARMVMARAGSLRLPMRWFAIPQCWRYERMTRGRRREHYQWNMDIWGEPSVPPRPSSSMRSSPAPSCSSCLATPCGSVSTAARCWRRACGAGSCATAPRPLHRSA